jgi:hypothetical protein
MEFSEEAIREERERLSFNHPGFNYPLMHRWIRKNDTLEMARVIRRSAHHLKGFINWAQYAPRWDFKQIQRFVNDHVNPEPPRMHLVFLLGKQIVGVELVLVLREQWKCMLLKSGVTPNSIISVMPIMNIVRNFRIN